MNTTRTFRNGTVESLPSDSVSSEQAASLSLPTSQLGSLFEEDTANLSITCTVSNSFGNDHYTTDIRKCGM